MLRWNTAWCETKSILTREKQLLECRDFLMYVRTCPWTPPNREKWNLASRPNKSISIHNCGHIQRPSESWSVAAEQMASFLFPVSSTKYSPVPRRCTGALYSQHSIHKQKTTRQEAAVLQPTHYLWRQAFAGVTLKNGLNVLCCLHSSWRLYLE